LRRNYGVIAKPKNTLFTLKKHLQALIVLSFIQKTANILVSTKIRPLRKLNIIKFLYHEQICRKKKKI